MPTAGRRGFVPRRRGAPSKRGRCRALTAGTRARGAVTAELAVAMPALVAVTVALVWLIAATVAQLRCVDAAREGVRALARGEAVGAAREIAAAVAPERARIDILERSRVVQMRVAAQVSAPGWLGERLPALTVHASAVGVREPADWVACPGE